VHLTPKPAHRPHAARSRGSLETLPPGTRFGRYELIRRLAIGGMAELYLARATGIEGFEKIVVLKRILPQHAANEDFVRMFLDEARLTATIQHPNVASVQDIGRCEDGLFFTMEYVHGEDVRTILQMLTKKTRTLPLEHAIAIGIGAAAGLHAAHEKQGADGKPLGIVHRDISPSNLLVSYDGGVKIIDFGIAKAARRQTETRAGTLKGKIAYMSPEQCVGDEIDRRSDVFSLGVVLYELTTGVRLFPGENEYAAMRQIVDQDAVPPSKRKRGYPPDLEAILLRALRRKRDERYGSAEELQLALEQFVRTRGLVVSTAQLGYWMRELMPERAGERIGGLGELPSAPRRRMPLRPPPTPAPGTEVLSPRRVTPTPLPLEALPSRPPTQPLPELVGLGTGADRGADGTVGTWMFRGADEPSISIAPQAAGTPAPVAGQIDLQTLTRQRHWHVAVAAGIAASVSAVIAAVIVMMLLGRADHAAVKKPPAAPVVTPIVVAPAARPTPEAVPVPVTVTVPVAIPVTSRAAAPDPKKPTARPVRKAAAKTVTKKDAPAEQPAKKWNPDSALPPM